MITQPTPSPAPSVRYSVEHLNTLAVAQMLATHRDWHDFDVMLKELRFCDDLGQLVAGPWGMVAWVRCAPEHLPAFHARDADTIMGLSRQELTTGPVLLFAEMLCLQPGLCRLVIREMANLAGVQLIGGWRMKGDRFTLRRTREGRRCRG